MRISIIILLGLCVWARANPDAGFWPSGFLHITSEHLVLSVSPTNTSLCGTFTLATFTLPVSASTRAEILNGRGANERLEVPIWIPASGWDSEVENILIGLDKRYDVDKKELGKMASDKELIDASTKSEDLQLADGPTMSPEDTERLKRALGFTVSLPGKLMATDAWLDKDSESAKKATAAGFRTFIFRFLLRADAVIDETPPLTLSYQVPSLRSRSDGRFFYVPMFWCLFDTNPVVYLPRSSFASTGDWIRSFDRKIASTADTNRFCIVVRPEDGCSLTVTNGAQVCTLRSGQSVVCSPRHLQPIRGVAWSEADKGEPPRNVHGEASGSKP